MNKHMHKQMIKHKTRKSVVFIRRNSFHLFGYPYIINSCSHNAFHYLALTLIVELKIILENSPSWVECEIYK